MTGLTGCLADFLTATDFAAAALATEGCTNIVLRTGDGGLGWPEQAPFDAIIVTAAAPEIPPANSPPSSTARPAKKNRGRVDILRVKAGRGGKTVTVVKNFVGIGLPEKEQLARAMQRACGTGGTVKDGQIEIQGDKRAEVARILTEANFRPVFAGG